MVGLQILDLPIGVRAPAPQPETPPTMNFLDRLKTIEGLPQGTPEALYDAGYVSAQTVKTASAEDLMKVKGISKELATRLVDEFMSMPGAAPAPAPAK